MAPITTPTTFRPDAAAAAADRRPVRRSQAPARRTLRALADDAGQGTVEYVGLLLLMATILAGVVGLAGELGGKDAIGKKVVNQIGNSIDTAGKGAR